MILIHLHTQNRILRFVRGMTFNDPYSSTYPESICTWDEIQWSLSDSNRFPSVIVVFLHLRNRYMLILSGGFIFFLLLLSFVLLFPFSFLFRFHTSRSSSFSCFYSCFLNLFFFLFLLLLLLVLLFLCLPLLIPLFSLVVHVHGESGWRSGRQSRVQPLRSGIESWALHVG